MRQGPNYAQWVDRFSDGCAYLKLPLEIEHDWEEMTTVIWQDNGNGIYTLIPSKNF